MFLFCLVFAMFCARLFICALWSPAGKGLTSWLSFVVSSVSLSLSHWYPGSGVVLDCIDSWSLHHYLLLQICSTKLFAHWEIFHAFLSSADFFFQNQLFRKILSRILSDSQTDWIQIRPDILSGLILVQSVCKGYEQTALEGNELRHSLCLYAA